MRTVNELIELLSSSPWIISLFAILSMIKLINQPHIFYFLFRGFHRFKQIESHAKISETLSFLKDEDLKLFYQDRLKKEVFEYSGGIKFYNEKYLRIYLNIYPKLRDKFNYVDLYRLKKYIQLTREGKLTVSPKSDLIVVFSVNLFFIASAIVVFYVIVSVLAYESIRIDESLFLPVVFFFLIFLIRRDKYLKANRLRKILAEIQS